LLMETDVDRLFGARRHKRSAERTMHRNGHRDRTLDTRLGSLQLRVPKLLLARNDELGVAIPPAAAALPYAGALRIATRPLQEGWAVRPLALCTRAPHTLPTAARVLISHLMQRLPAP